MKSETAGDAPHHLEAWEREFRSPGNWYRGAPFWSWNERLTPAECVRQSRDMLAHGMGGGFMHSREGLETPYMGREWMDCVKAVVRDAKKTGFVAWLYDEDRWPSGAAGGIVTIPHPEHRMKALIYTLREATEYSPSRDDLRAFGVTLAGRAISKLGDPSKGSHVLVFQVHVSETSDWYNGGAYLDTMSAPAVRAFIDSTHEPYRKAVGAEFGKSVPGIFTDEPNYAGFRGRLQRPHLPWTPKLPEVFRRRYGYSLLDALPCLFFEKVAGMNARRVRRDYRDCVTHLFVTNFSRQIGEWCGRHGAMLTGHWLSEGSLSGQTDVIGAAMRHYEHEQLPGIDILRESIEEDLTVKQVASAARQFGRPRVLSELYGCTGWDFTFEGQKWVGDWQFAGGVNYRCQHLTLYGLRGCRKRDYPPSFNYQSPWWEYNRHIEGYFARLSYMLTRGEAVRDVLVVHPIESAWAVHMPEDRSGTDALNAKLAGVMKALFEANIDFDFGDEEHIARFGKVQGGRLRLGRADYKVVVVPPAVTLRSSTLKLIEKFAASGGRVVAVKPLPKLIDCEPSPRAGALARRPFETAGPGGRSIAQAVARSLGGSRLVLASGARPASKVRYQLRAEGQSRILFLCNTDRARGVKLSVSMPHAGKIEEWDLVAGGRRAVEASSGKAQTRFTAELGPTGSALFVVGPRCGQGAEGARPRLRTVRRKALGGPWSYELSEPNALTLDFCRYSLDGGRLSERMPIWRAERDVRKALGLSDTVMNGGTMRWKRFAKPRDTGHKLRLELEFKVEKVPAGGIFLAIERPEVFRISLNGRQAGRREAGWFVDRSFRKVPLGKPRRGRNVITLTTSYHDEYELEDCYLVGEFGVNPRTIAITSLPRSLRKGSWVEQGLPFYSGVVICFQDVELKRPGSERCFLAIDSCACTLVEVTVNGASAGVSMWPPFEVELTRHLRPGRNRIGIKVVSSRRNLLGPLHHTARKLGWTGAGQFRTEGSDWTDDYRFVPCGMTGGARLEWRS